MQKAGAEGVFDVQFAEEFVGVGREEGWVYGVETGGEGRIRKAMMNSECGVRNWDWSKVGIRNESAAGRWPNPQAGRLRYAGSGMVEWLQR